MKKQTLRVLITIIIASFLLVSCEQTKGNDTGANKTSTKEPTATTEKTSEAEEVPNVPTDVDFKGKEFRILIYKGGTDIDNIDFYDNNDQEGEMIYEAAHMRQGAVEGKYGITIKPIVTTADNVSTLAMTSISAGTDDYELVAPMMNTVYTLVEKNALVELHNVENLDLTKTYWDQQIQKDLAIGGKLFTITGDISISDEELNICIAFNKTFAAEYDINPYQYIKDNNWTLDTMYTLAKLGTHDLNSDGKFDKNDEYGLGHAFSSAFCLFHGSGERFASLDESGKPVITINDSRSAEVVKKIADIYNDNSVVGVVEKNFGDWTTLNANMVAGKVMFRPANIYNLRQYLQMTDVCGVLPIPKYEATQDRYYHLVLTNACSGYCVPSTNSDLAMTGIIMEELAYYGRKDLTPAYYDSYIKSRLTPDLDTRDMFDIIFSSKIYDVGYTFGWGSLVNVIGSAVSTNGGFTSKLDAAMSGAQTAMDKTYNDLIDVWGE